MPPVLPESTTTTEAAPVTADRPSWSYTVSVRSLCEFTAKRGDLDRRFTPSATATEGLIGQGAVTARRGQDYETEVALEGVCGFLRVRGRADGYDPRRRCLEEIKTIRGHPDDIPANRRRLHWAQLQTYGALFCRTRGLEAVSLALVYFDIDAQTEVELHELSSAADLEAALAERCAQFEAWAAQETAHRAARDAGLAALDFPPGAFRAGQRLLAEAVYRAAAGGRCLLAQAPTGIGKTVGTLFPMLRAMPGQALDKIAYLTCKGTGRQTALEALEGLREGTAGRALRVLAMVAKDQACEHPDKACHGDACPLARGFYDRLPAARAEAVAEGWLEPAVQRRVALRHGVCPYYLGQELLRWVDVLVGDVNHAFDLRGVLWGLAQSQGWRMGMLVDEAHNLVERARQMYSAELRLDQVLAAQALAPTALRPVLGRLAAAAEALAAAQDGDYSVLDAVPDRFSVALQAAGAALGEHFQGQPTAVGPLLNFHFQLQHVLKLVEMLGEHSLFDIQRGNAGPSAGDRASTTGPAAGGREAGVAMGMAVGMDAESGVGLGVGMGVGIGAASVSGQVDDPGEVIFSLRNVVPAPFLRPRFQAAHSVTLFSATLGPPDYPTALLGLPDDTAWIDVPPAFPPEHLTVRIADRISTRYAHRGRSLTALVEVIARQFDAHPGNYLAFFSSHDYLQQAAARLAGSRPDIAQWRQDRQMDTRARQGFLERFEADGRGIGFAVLGGVFAEGVDLPGSRLIGAFIATLGLPAVSPVQEEFRARIDRIFGADQSYADLVPALQKVVQAAGRVLRTPEDRGWLWLMDDRYRRPEVTRLLPPWWQIAPDARRPQPAGRTGVPP